MRNLVLYAAEKGGARPLVSCDPEDASRFFILSSAGMEYARIKRAQGVPIPAIHVVREERETDAGGVQLSKQEFTLLDPATFAAKGKPAKTLADLFKKPAKEDKE